MAWCSTTSPFAFLEPGDEISFGLLGDLLVHIIDHEHILLLGGFRLEGMGVRVLHRLVGDVGVVLEQLEERLLFERVAAGDHQHADLRLEVLVCSRR